MKTHIIYHEHCIDGFGAAFIVAEYCERNNYPYYLYPASYDKHPLSSNEGDLAKDDTIIIVDFSVPPKLLLKWCKQVSHLVWLDHHKTAMDTWAKFWNGKDENDYPKNLDVDLDIERSGTGITWDYFNLNKPRPLWVDLIEDRDLWKFKYSRTKQFHAWISSYPRTIGTWKHLLDEFDAHGDMCICEGTAIMRAHQKLVESICENAIPITINGQTGLAANCTGQFASDVGHALAVASSTFGATWYQHKSGNIKWSLRSVDSLDVAEIARSFGGGGHRNAAGFIARFAATNSGTGELFLHSHNYYSWRKNQE